MNDYNLYKFNMLNNLITYVIIILLICFNTMNTEKINDERNLKVIKEVINLFEKNGYFFNEVTNDDDDDGLLMYCENFATEFKPQIKDKPYTYLIPYDCKFTLKNGYFFESYNMMEYIIIHVDDINPDQDSKEVFIITYFSDKNANSNDKINSNTFLTNNQKKVECYDHLCYTTIKLKESDEKCKLQIFEDKDYSKLVFEIISTTCTPEWKNILSNYNLEYNYVKLFNNGFEQTIVIFKNTNSQLTTLYEIDNIKFTTEFLDVKYFTLDGVNIYGTNIPLMFDKINNQLVLNERKFCPLLVNNRLIDIKYHLLNRNETYTLQYIKSSFDASKNTLQKTTFCFDEYNNYLEDLIPIMENILKCFCIFNGEWICKDETKNIADCPKITTTTASTTTTTAITTIEVTTTEATTIEVTTTTAITTIEVTTTTAITTIEVAITEATAAITKATTTTETTTTEDTTTTASTTTVSTTTTALTTKVIISNSNAVTILQILTKSLAEKSKITKSPAEKSKITKSPAEKAKITKSPAEKAKITKSPAEKARLTAEAEKARLAAEAEKARLAAEAEKARLTAEAEKARLAAEQAKKDEAEKARLAAEKAKQDAEDAAEQAKKDEAEKARLAAEKTKQDEAEQAKKDAAEKAKLTTIPTTVLTTILTTIPTTILTTIPTTVLTTTASTTTASTTTTALTTVLTTIPTTVSTTTALTTKVIISNSNAVTILQILTSSTLKSKVKITKSAEEKARLAAEAEKTRLAAEAEKARLAAEKAKQDAENAAEQAKKDEAEKAKQDAENAAEQAKKDEAEKARLAADKAKQDAATKDTSTLIVDTTKFTSTTTISSIFLTSMLILLTPSVESAHLNQLMAPNVNNYKIQRCNFNYDTICDISQRSNYFYIVDSNSQKIDELLLFDITVQFDYSLVYKPTSLNPSNENIISQLNYFVKLLSIHPEGIQFCINNNGLHFTNKVTIDLLKGLRLVNNDNQCYNITLLNQKPILFENLIIELFNEMKKEDKSLFVIGNLEFNKINSNKRNMNTNPIIFEKNETVNNILYKKTSQIIPFDKIKEFNSIDNVEFYSETIQQKIQSLKVNSSTTLLEITQFRLKFYSISKIMKQLEINTQYYPNLEIQHYTKFLIILIISVSFLILFVLFIVILIYFIKKK